MLGLDLTTNKQITIVIFDSNVVHFNHTPEKAKVLLLPNGEQLPYFTLNADDRFFLGPDSFGFITE